MACHIDDGKGFVIDKRRLGGWLPIGQGPKADSSNQKYVEFLS